MCRPFESGTKGPLSDAESEIDREAELEADRLPKPRKPAPDKAEVKGAFVQTAQYVFVQGTAERPKSATATTGPHKARAPPRAQSRSANDQHVVVLEDRLPTANPPASILQGCTEGFYEYLARQSTVEHLFQLRLGFRRCRIWVSAIVVLS